VACSVSYWSTAAQACPALAPSFQDQPEEVFGGAEHVAFRADVVVRVTGGYDLDR
jgi:hypothetical protein